MEVRRGQFAEGCKPRKHSPQVPEASCSVHLSERDAAEVMASAEKPPAPNEAALQAAMRKFRLERPPAPIIHSDAMDVFIAWEKFRLLYNLGLAGVVGDGAFASAQNRGGL